MNIFIILFWLFIIFNFKAEAVEVRIKDIAHVEGARSNQLVGYGLVIGLKGTGDGRRAFFTVRSIANMLRNLGVNVPEELISVKNVAAVIVTAELPPFISPGTKIDIEVASLGDAKSIAGGILLQTPLLGADKKVYAVAQGKLTVGRGEMEHPTVACIPQGAIIEEELGYNIVKEDSINLILAQQDFTTAAHIASAINDHFGEDIAIAKDAAKIVVRIPTEYRKNPVGFIAEIEDIKVLPSVKARVVINERTGTVVMGKDIRIDACAISHGNLSLIVEEKKEKVVFFEEATTVEDVVKALNAIGATPQDVIVILQALRKAGKLHAQIETM